MNFLENFTIGADPELFIYNTKTKKVVSSIGIIPGEKNKPFRTKDMPNGFGLEIDNILAEFNIPPVTNLQDWLYVMNYMKDYIRNHVKKINSDLDILCTASKLVPKDQLQSKEALLFGCDPDYNVYTQQVNPKPTCTSKCLRSAGFHIHFGYKNNNIESSLNMIKYLDAYLGVPSVLLDSDVKRRTLYGKAGSFRLTDYGFEYRVLSSYFLSNDKLLTWVWERINTALNAYFLSYNLPEPDEICNAINNSDVNYAKQIIDEYGLDKTILEF